MPIMRCVINGQVGYKFGVSGKCYVGKDAKEKAEQQGKAIESSKRRGDKK